MTNCHGNNLDIWKIFRIFKGGEGGENPSHFEESSSHSAVELKIIQKKCKKIWKCGKNFVYLLCK